MQLINKGYSWGRFFGMKNSSRSDVRKEEYAAIVWQSVRRTLLRQIHRDNVEDYGTTSFYANTVNIRIIILAQVQAAGPTFTHQDTSFLHEHHQTNTVSSS